MSKKIVVIYEYESTGEEHDAKMLEFIKKHADLVLDVPNEEPGAEIIDIHAFVHEG